MTSTIEETLVSPQGQQPDLVVGLYNGELVGIGVTGVTFSIYENGTELFDRKFSNIANAVAYFTDNALDLGSIPATGPLDLKMVLTVTSTTAGSGFYAGMIVGGGSGTGATKVTTAAPFAQAMASFGAASSTSTASAAISHPAPKLLLAAAGHAIA